MSILDFSSWLLAPAVDGGGWRSPTRGKEIFASHGPAFGTVRSTTGRDSVLVDPAPKANALLRSCLFFVGVGKRSRIAVVLAAIHRFYRVVRRKF